MSDYSNEIGNMTFSFSRCHYNCLYEWYLRYLELDEDGIPTHHSDQNFYAAFGKFCHEILEKILLGEMSADEGVDYYILNFDEQILCYDVKESIREKYFELGLMYFAEENFEWLNGYEVIGVETKCDFSIGTRKFVGFIDLLLRDRNTGDIIVVDHKSSEYPLGKKGQVLKKNAESYEAYKNQLYLYSTSIKEKFGEYPRELWWNYFKERKILKIPFSETGYISAREWAESQIKRLEIEEEFLPQKDYFYCNNLCEFRNSCEYKDEEDEE